THALFAFPQRRVFAYQLSHVHARPNVTGEGSIRVIARYALVRKPTMLAIVTSKAILHNEGVPGVERLCINLETTLQIVRVHAFSPTITHFLLHAAAGKLQPGL